MLSYDEARQKVIEVAGRRLGEIPTERVELAQALGRTLAEEVKADRDYPPFNRSTRDGFAVRAADIAGECKFCRLIGESEAGTAFSGKVGPGECVQIMTGAPLAAGAAAVVMLEHTRQDTGEVIVERHVHAGENVVAAGSAAKAGQVVLERATRLGYAELALAAQVGHI